MKFLKTIASMGLLIHTAIAIPKQKQNKYVRESPLVRLSYAENQDLSQVGIHGRDLQQLSPMRIYFHTDQFEETYQDSDNNATIAKGEALIEQVLPQVSDIFAKAVSLGPAPTLVVPGNICDARFDVPPAWSDVQRGLPDTDLLIFISAWDAIGGQAICEEDESLSTLATSTACAIDPTTDRPVVGFANVCLNGLETNEDNEVDPDSVDMMVDVLISKLLGVMAMDSELFKYYRNSKTGKPLTPRDPTWLGSEAGFQRREYVSCVGGQYPQELNVPCDNTLGYGKEEVFHGVAKSNRSYYEIVLPTVAQVGRNQFDCQSLRGVRLENQPTSKDCFGSHFDERTWYFELMSAIYEKDAAYLSPLTLALLEDTGWYHSDFTQSRNSPFGLGAGCDFVEKDCLVDGDIPDYSEGFFCNDVRPMQQKQQSCGPSHDYRGKCDIQEFQYPQRTYLTPFNFGPKIFTHADFCPIVNTDVTDCSDATATTMYPEIEKFGNESKCMSLSIEDEKDTSTAVCMKSSCNNDMQTFDFYVQGTLYQCLEDFEEITVEINQYNHTFHCPRLSQVCPDMFCPSMCSGKGICDWSLETPRCKCFDVFDTTKGCYDSAPLEADECSWVKEAVLFVPTDTPDTTSLGVQKSVASMVFVLPFVLSLAIPYLF